jgi:hypothetical protein
MTEIQTEMNWLTPFDGSGIEWHEGLPSPYTYQESDFSKLVAAVHEYEARLMKVPEMLKWIDKMARHHHRSYGHAKSFAKCEFPVCKGGREILADWEEA